jgi:hypothetical protein
MEWMHTFTDPNSAVYDGPDRIFQVPFASGTVFRRRGGKAVDLHHRYQAATANSSNLAGFAEVEDVGVAGGRPASVSDGDLLPVNMSLEKTNVFPTSGDVVCTEAHLGKDYDIFVDANGIQYVDLTSSVMGVLRASRIVTQDGLWVSCGVPPDLRYGNK